MGRGYRSPAPPVRATPVHPPHKGEGDRTLPLDRVPRGADTLGQRRAHELVEIAAQHAGRVRRLDVRAQLLDHLVGLQDVAADRQSYRL